MDDEQLLRYSRQIMLPQIDIAGQTRLANASVLIIGLGGLGSPVAMYLASAGVGKLVINDFDVVDLSNLQRQILHTTPAIGTHKTDSAQKTLQALNPDIEVIGINQRLSEAELQQQVSDVDLVVDASDNFATRFLLNEVCVRLHKPLVMGAAIRMEGQVAVFRNDLPGTACYRCLYPDTEQVAETCSETGILAPVVGIIGCVQATEAIKLLLSIGESLNNKLLILDAMVMEWRKLTLRKDQNCPVCSCQN
jgi:molybdopterin/thiamine biosynthesis adenylyltransferase